MPERRRKLRISPHSLASIRIRRAGRQLLLEEQGAVPETLSHYTDAAGALNIIRSGTIWATDALFMNDASELQLAKDIFEAKLNRWLGQHIKLKVNRYAFADSFWESFLGSGDPGEQPLYVACFCAHDDLLSQWRAYATSGLGYSLQFDASSLDDWGSDDVELFSVVYEATRHVRLARQLVLNGVGIAKRAPVTKRVRRTALFHTAGSVTGEMARTFAYRVKHESFAEEQEWRLVYQVPPADPLTEDSEPKTREFRATHRGIAPYVVVDFAHEDDDNIDEEALPPLPLVSLEAPIAG